MSPFIHRDDHRIYYMSQPTINDMPEKKASTRVTAFIILLIRIYFILYTIQVNPGFSMAVLAAGAWPDLSSLTMMSS